MSKSRKTFTYIDAKKYHCHAISRYYLKNFHNNQPSTSPRKYCLRLTLQLKRNPNQQHSRYNHKCYEHQYKYHIPYLPISFKILNIDLLFKNEIYRIIPTIYVHIESEEIHVIGSQSLTNEQTIGVIVVIRRRTDFLLSSQPVRAVLPTPKFFGWQAPPRKAMLAA